MLPVEVEIYTTTLTPDFKIVKDRLVYTGTATIDSWRDGNFLFGGGIKIPFEDINTVESDEDFGMVYATTTLPDGRKVELKQEFGVSIKPE